jgi:hypothetical protein
VAVVYEAMTREELKMTVLASSMPVRWYVTGIVFTIIFAGVAADAQGTGTPKGTTTTVSSSKYGAGGTEETTSDDKFQIVKEVWKDKSGQLREVHSRIPGKNGVNDQWVFYKKNGIGAAVFEYFPGRDGYLRQTSASDGPMCEIGKAEAEEWIEKIEKQFAEDGTIIDLSTLKKKEVGTKIEPSKLPDGKKKENDVDTKIEPPKISTNKDEMLDSNLVGIWRSTNMTAASGVGTTSGGAGISMTIRGDGTVSLDYSKMEPFVFKNVQGQETQVQKWTGKASGHIATRNATIIVKTVDSSSDVTGTLTSYGKTTDNSVHALGPMLIPQPATVTYDCKDGHLKITITMSGIVLNTFELSREK